MEFKHLTDVHTGRNAEWVQHDIDRCTIFHIWHIFDRIDLGNDTLVTVTAGHLVTFRNLSLLNNIDLDDFIDTRCQFCILVFSVEDAYAVNCTGTAMRYLQGVITDFSGLFTEDGKQQLFFWCGFGLSLWGDLSDKDITFTDFCTNHDNTTGVQITACTFGYIRNITCDFFITEFCAAAFNVIFFDMNRCIEVFRLHSFRHDDSIFVVVTMPCHEGYCNVLTKCKFSVFHGWTIRKDVTRSDSFALPYNRLLIQAC